MKTRLLAGIICLTILLPGCAKADQGSNLIVRQIRVVMQTGNGTEQKEFYSSGALRRILGAIRLLGQESRPKTDPEYLDGPTMHIIFTHTGGQQYTYIFKADRFIRRHHGPWRETDPDKTLQLQALIRQLPSESTAD